MGEGGIGSLVASDRWWHRMALASAGRYFCFTRLRRCFRSICGVDVSVRCVRSMCRVQCFHSMFLIDMSAQCVRSMCPLTFLVLCCVHDFVSDLCLQDLRHKYNRF